KADLTASDFAPFKALSDLPLGMTAHIRFTALDDAPATQSAKVIAMIREEIGFGGLLMSDDIGMEALAGGFATRAAAALAAGCDLVLHCKGDMPAMEEVALAAPVMSDQAIARGEAALDRRQPPESVDMAALDAELEALLSGRAHG
ncbi:MAG: beta-hexosaminidase, partial [Rhodobacteraceae bacterium]